MKLVECFDERDNAVRNLCESSSPCQLKLYGLHEREQE